MALCLAARCANVPRYAMAPLRVIKKNRDSYLNYATPKKVWFIYLEMAVKVVQLETTKAIENFLKFF
jgi:hypothetical protein